MINALVKFRITKRHVKCKK